MGGFTGKISLKVLLDTNIFVDIALERQPYFAKTLPVPLCRFLHLAD